MQPLEAASLMAQPAGRRHLRDLVEGAVEAWGRDALGIQPCLLRSLAEPRLLSGGAA